MVILIPAYEPDERLVEVVTHLRRALPGHPMVVVDDGSDVTHRTYFEQVRDLGCDVLRHASNRGKGAALKTGFDHIAWHHPGHDVVCADCDGQHRADDIAAVADALDAGAAPIVLGSRAFTGDVPTRSRFGNTVTRKVFAAITGVPLGDTQTGLRAYRHDVLEWLGTVKGDRFEYEMNVLLDATAEHLAIREIPIETVYLDDNSSSHFRPLTDSARIYAPMLRFVGSSLTSSVVDIVSFVLFLALGAGLAFAVVTSRILSAFVNYRINRDLVFERGGGWRSGLRYAALAVVILTANYYTVRFMHDGLHIPTLLAKVIADVTLFSASYVVQRRFVFAGRRHERPDRPDRTADVIVVEPRRESIEIG